MWIKVCGCTDPQNTAEVSACGVSAIGINFYPRSKRFVGDRAAEVRDAIASDVDAIGLFVDEPVEVVRNTFDELGLDAIQLHGHEESAVVRELAPRPVYRAVRVSNGRIGEQIEHELESYRDCSNLAGILIDAASSKGLGGTGESIDWNELAAAARGDWPRLVLAGGLTPENVDDAVAIVRPWGVDVASGVESEPGVKNVKLVQNFVVAAKSSDRQRPPSE